MQSISYARHQFPAEIIRHAVWLYLRFTLSYRDVEELLAERGVETSYEMVRRWVLKVGPAFARNMRRLRPKPTGIQIFGPIAVTAPVCMSVRWLPSTIAFGTPVVGSMRSRDAHFGRQAAPVVVDVIADHLDAGEVDWLAKSAAQHVEMSIDARLPARAGPNFRTQRRTVS